MSIGRTNATQSNMKNSSKESYLAGENISKNDPVVITGRFNDMVNTSMFSESFTTPDNTSTIISPDGMYIVNVTSRTIPSSMNIYKRNNLGNYVKMTTGVPTLASNILSTAFSPDGKYLLVGMSATPYHHVFSVTENGFSGMSWTSLGLEESNTAVRFIKFSDDGTFLLIGGSNGTGSTPTKLYKRAVNTYFRIDTTGVLEKLYPLSAAFSADNSLIALGYSSNNRIIVYNINVDGTLTKRDMTSIPSSPVTYLRFIEKNKKLLAGHSGGSPSMYVYNYSESTISKTTDFSLSGILRSANMTPDEKYFIASTTSTDSILDIYSVGADSAFIRIPFSSAVGSVTIQQSLITPQGELILIRENAVPLALRFRQYIYKADGGYSGYSGYIDGIGYAKDTVEKNNSASIVRLKDFDNIVKI